MSDYIPNPHAQSRCGEGTGLFRSLGDADGGAREAVARRLAVRGGTELHTPQIYVDIDRNKAQVLGFKVSDIFNALQSTPGTYYINDFNVFGRTWQVNIQADTPFRQRTEDIDKIYVRKARGGMIAASLFGIFLIPPLFTAERLRVSGNFSIRGVAFALRLGHDANLH